MLYIDEPIGAEEELVEKGEYDDDLINEVRASPPPCEYNDGKDLVDDPQLTLGNLKNFQANIREFSRFTVVSNHSSSVFMSI